MKSILRYLILFLYSVFEVGPRWEPQLSKFKVVVVASSFQIQIQIQNSSFIFRKLRLHYIHLLTVL
jgi:hypothetical protein